MSDSTLNRVVASGTAAQRAAFTPSPATPASGPAQGYIWYETDTGLLWTWTGSVWTTIGGNPGLIKITEQTPSAAASVTFSSLGSYTHLRLLFSARGDTSATSANLNVQFNGDTGSNYDRIGSQFTGTTPGSTEGIGTTSAVMATIAAATAPANVPGVGDCTFYDYRGTSLQKSAICHNHYKLANSSTNVWFRTFAFSWRNAAAITSIVITPSAGNVTGKFSLYGMP